MSGRGVRVAFLAFVFVGFTACGSSGGASGAGGPPPPPCTSAMVPDTVHLTVSGFSQCSCFNGTFALTREKVPASTTSWSSPPIMGCPGQKQTAFLKFSIDPGSFGVGITDMGSDPGSGNSDFSPTAGGTCSPLRLSGGHSLAGNIGQFCPGNEDAVSMAWSLQN